MFVYLWSEYTLSEELKAKLAKNVKCPVVYKFLDKNDEVLYVGKTTQFCSRWSQHIRSDKPMTKVKTVVLYTYESESEASFVESQAIVHYQPVWNIQGKDGTRSNNKIGWSEKVVLKVLTKHLNTFIQGLYANIE